MGQCVNLVTAENSSDNANEWSHHLFACFDDCGECLLAWTSPSVIFALNAREAGFYPCGGNNDKSLVCNCLLFLCLSGAARMIWGCIIRPSIRRKYGIAGSPLKDCCTVLFCPHCALIQERQQLKEVVPSSSTNQVIVPQNPVTVAPLCYNPPQQQAPDQCVPQQ